MTYRTLNILLSVCFGLIAARAAAAPDDWLAQANLSEQKIQAKIASYARSLDADYGSEFEIQVAMSEFDPDLETINQINLPNAQLFSSLIESINGIRAKTGFLDKEIEAFQCPSSPIPGAEPIPGQDLQNWRFSLGNSFDQINTELDIYGATQNRISVLSVIPFEKLNRVYEAGWGIINNSALNCAQVKAQLLAGNFSNQLDDYLDSVIAAIESNAADVAAARTVVENWKTAIRDTRNKLISKHRALGDKASIADNLVQLIIVIGLFGVGTMLVPRVFSERVALEWVSSGQVIQFVTVTILLSVILALGLSGVIAEETLGTLLGGIGGYVLSQGVGRAAAHNARAQGEEDKGAAGRQPPKNPKPAANPTAPPEPDKTPEETKP